MLETAMSLPQPPIAPCAMRWCDPVLRSATQTGEWLHDLGQAGCMCAAAGRPGVGWRGSTALTAGRGQAPCQRAETAIFSVGLPAGEEDLRTPERLVRDTCLNCGLSVGATCSVEAGLALACTIQLASPISIASGACIAVFCAARPKAPTGALQAIRTGESVFAFTPKVPDPALLLASTVARATPALLVAQSSKQTLNAF
eukprot:517475-Rhodomonas_salina.1